jgi:hypothetical protein
VVYVSAVINRVVCVVHVSRDFCSRNTLIEGNIYSDIPVVAVLSEYTLACDIVRAKQKRQAAVVVACCR